MSRPNVITDSAFRVPRDGATGPPGKDGEAGQPGIVWRGLWNRRTEYKPGEAVSFEGGSFVCVQETVGREPSNPRFWNVLSERGERGEQGEQGGAGQRGRSFPHFLVEDRLAALEAANAPQVAIAGVNITKAQVVYIDDSGKAQLASALLPDMPVGLAFANAMAGQELKYYANGFLSFENWILEPGKMYFLSETPGAISTTSPDDGGYSVVIGTALDESILKLDIQRTVQL